MLGMMHTLWLGMYFQGFAKKHGYLMQLYLLLQLVCEYAPFTNWRSAICGIQRTTGVSRRTLIGLWRFPSDSKNCRFLALFLTSLDFLAIREGIMLLRDLQNSFTACQLTVTPAV
jgi:hypothetical protein